MQKLSLFILTFLLLFSGCSQQNRLDSSGVNISWLEQTVPTQAPPAMPTAPANPAVPVERTLTEPTIPAEPMATLATEGTLPVAPIPNVPTPMETTEPLPAAADANAPSQPAAEAPETTIPSAQSVGMQQTTLVLSNPRSAGNTVDCWLYIPEAPQESPGLIVYLHGGSGKGTDLNLITAADGFPQYLQDGRLGKISCYVLIPQLPKESKGWADMDDTLMDMIYSVVREYGIDSGNISLTGHSMGGTGVWSIAAAHPGFFARIAPLSGSIRNTAQNVQALESTSVYAFVGTEDTIVDPQSSIAFISALKQAGADTCLTELDGADHFSVPEKAYLGDYGLVDWLQGN